MDLRLCKNGCGNKCWRAFNRESWRSTVVQDATGLFARRALVSASGVDTIDTGSGLSESAPANQRMKLTGAAILVSRGMKVLQAAPAAYPYRSPGSRGCHRCSGGNPNHEAHPQGAIDTQHVCRVDDFISRPPSGHREHRADRSCPRSLTR